MRQPPLCHPRACRTLGPNQQSDSAPKPSEKCLRCSLHNPSIKTGHDTTASSAPAYSCMAQPAPCDQDLWQHPRHITKQQSLASMAGCAAAAGRLAGLDALAGVRGGDVVNVSVAPVAQGAVKAGVAEGVAGAVGGLQDAGLAWKDSSGRRSCRRPPHTQVLA